MDVRAGFAVAVFVEPVFKFLIGGVLLLLGLKAGHLQLRRQGVAAVAAVVVGGNRGKHHRHGAGGGNGAGKAQSAQVEAHGVEVFLREVQAFARPHIGGGNDGERAFAVHFQIAEGGFAEKVVFKLLLQEVAASVFGRGKAGQVGHGKSLFDDLALEVLVKETLVKHGDGFFAFEREIGGEDGAAGYADHQIDIGH